MWTWKIKLWTVLQIEGTAAWRERSEEEGAILSVFRSSMESFSWCFPLTICPTLVTMIITAIISAWHKTILLLIMEKNRNTVIFSLIIKYCICKSRIFLQMKKNAPFFAECHLVRTVYYNFFKPQFSRYSPRSLI